MKAITKENSRALASLAEGFAACRAERRRYAEPLKRRAVEFNVAGMPANALAEAVGVSRPSIALWRKPKKTSNEVLPPTRLRVASERARSAQASRESEAPPSARIRLRSGVEIEIPATALTEEILASLSRLGSEACSR